MEFPQNIQNVGRGRGKLPLPRGVYYTDSGQILNPHVLLVDPSLGFLTGLTGAIPVPHHRPQIQVPPTPVPPIDTAALPGPSRIPKTPLVPIPVPPLPPTPTGRIFQSRTTPGPSPRPSGAAPDADSDHEEISIRMGLGFTAWGDWGKPAQPVSMMRFMEKRVKPENWASVKMIRDIKRSKPGKMEANLAAMTISKSLEPKTGAGSTYGAQERLEKKQQYILQKYKKKVVEREDQPWLLKLSSTWGDSGNIKSKCFKGAKEGGISDHASYFVLIEQKTEEEKVVEAYPVDNWFDFKLINSYRNLTAEEAEEKFRKRNETYNYFSLMTRKRLNKGGGDGTSDEETCPLQRSARKRAKLGTETEEDGLRYSVNDWADSSDDEGKTCLDVEDDEGHVDYMSSSSESSSLDSDDVGEEVGKGSEVELLNSSQSERGAGSQQSI